MPAGPERSGPEGLPIPFRLVNFAPLPIGNTEGPEGGGQQMLSILLLAALIVCQLLFITIMAARGAAAGFVLGGVPGAAIAAMLLGGVALAQVVWFYR